MLRKWADYLKSKGLDPENQLCTDDFAGHLPHNTNLSLKAIEALGGFAMLCTMTGHEADGAEFRKAAQEMAARWAAMADDGDHYRLAFDKPGTWSQKYNLVWDKVLGLDLFPPEVARREVAYDLTKQNAFGLPLDNRRDYTKLDWIVWTATLAESRKDFEGDGRPDPQVRRRQPEPRPADRLVLDARRQAARLPGPLGRRRRLHQDAGRPVDVEEVVVAAVVRLTARDVLSLVPPLRGGMGASPLPRLRREGRGAAGEALRRGAAERGGPGGRG